MKRVLLLAAIAACKNNPSVLDGVGSGAPPAATPAPFHATDTSKRVALPPPPVRDYEAIARKLYADEPDYEKRWPVEFKVRVIEGVVQDLQAQALDLGEHMGAPYFADQVEFAWATAGAETPVVDQLVSVAYTPDTPAQTTADAVGAKLKQVVGQYAYLDHAIFKPKNAKEIAGDGLDIQIGIDLAGRERTGGWRQDHGLAEARFAKLNGRWQMTRFVVTSYDAQRAPALAFDDVTEGWLAAVPAATRSFLRERSGSDELHRMLLDDKHAPSPALDHLLPLAMDAHPGVAVVDIDNDGFDDLFVWDVSGPSVLLHNDGGRGFSDRTDQYGLALTGVSAAAFADLDNDGNLDLVVGRWFGHSEILFGAGGHFWPGAEGRFELPSQVASISLADVNGDGLLDIFFATSAHDFHQHLVALMAGDPAVKAGLSPVEIAQLQAAVPAAEAARKDNKLDANIYQFGPKNALMMNHGSGIFVDETDALGLTLFRNTLQAAFADFDGDGHPDLYLGNDFAPSNLYMWRAGKYVDVTADAGADRIYFGMGASVADFDNDGDLDLYATAMQSTAGNRIMSDASNFSTEHDDKDRAARKDAARGNTLLRNDGAGKWTDLTSTKDYNTVRSSSWAYSAQFVDIDGDGYLDVFSPNGFFTSSVAPEDPFVRDL